jgi:RNA polymerase sigma factor (sigma-70 family)
MRQGHERAFELLFKRYQARLFAFCRRLLGSPQDAEDVLQEVFAAAHAAILADSRPINARPWLYRIARNQCVNHLRKPSAVGVDSMDTHPYEHGVTTFEQVETREELRAIIADVHQLPNKQRTALVLREVDDFSYADIAQTMGTTLPSVKSLLARARVSLAQSSQGRKALAPLGLLALLRRLLPAKLKVGGSSGTGGTAGGVAGTPGTVAAAGGSGLTFTGVVSAATTGLGGALGAQAAVGVATAAIVAAGAVGVAKMDLGGHGQTAGAGGSATTSEASSPSGSSAAWRTAGAPPAVGTAAGSTTRAHAGHGQGATAGKSSLGDLPDLGHSVTRATGDATRAAASGASAATAAVASTTSAASDAASAAAASVKPPTSDVPPVPRLGEGTGLSDIQAPRLSDRHSVPPKLGPAQTLIP